MLKTTEFLKSTQISQKEYNFLNRLKYVKTNKTFYINSNMLKTKLLHKLKHVKNKTF